MLEYISQLSSADQERMQNVNLFALIWMKK